MFCTLRKTTGKCEEKNLIGKVFWKNTPIKTKNSYVNDSEIY